MALRLQESLRRNFLPCEHREGAPYNGLPGIATLKEIVPVCRNSDAFLKKRMLNTCFSFHINIPLWDIFLPRSLQQNPSCDLLKGTLHGSDGFQSRTEHRLATRD